MPNMPAGPPAPTFSIYVIIRSPTWTSSEITSHTRCKISRFRSSRLILIQVGTSTRSGQPAIRLGPTHQISLPSVILRERHTATGLTRLASTAPTLPILIHGRLGLMNPGHRTYMCRSTGLDSRSNATSCREKANREYPNDLLGRRAQTESSIEWEQMQGNSYKSCSMLPSLIVRPRSTDARYNVHKYPINTTATSNATPTAHPKAKFCSRRIKSLRSSGVVIPASPHARSAGRDSAADTPGPAPRSSSAPAASPAESAAPNRLPAIPPPPQPPNPAPATQSLAA